MPRNSLNAESNPTLRVDCAACGEATPTDVSNDPLERRTWALVGHEDGKSATYAVCAKCYDGGWRPPGHQTPS